MKQISAVKKGSLENRGRFGTQTENCNLLTPEEISIGHDRSSS
jgi:hypothetical protein